MKTNEQIETACAAWWDCHSLRPWSDIPEMRKEWYRESMRAALTALEKEQS